MVRKYGTPSISTLTEAKEKNQVRMEPDAYFDQLMLTTTNTDNMHMYIINLALPRTKLCMLQDELDKGSKSVYPKAMEARVCFLKYIIKEYEDTIVHYQAWYQFITEYHREEVDETICPQPSNS